MVAEFYQGALIRNSIGNCAGFYVMLGGAGISVENPVLYGLKK